MFVECRNLDGDIMNRVGGVQVIGHGDRDGKLNAENKEKVKP